MSNLHPKQFKNYMPAAQEGKRASDWLSTDEGDLWAVSNHWGVDHQHFNEGNNGLYSIKHDNSDDHDFWDVREEAMNWVPGYDG